jgi:hypothetical protein
VLVLPDEWSADEEAHTSMFRTDRAVLAGNATRCHWGNLGRGGRGRPSRAGPTNHGDVIGHHRSVGTALPSRSPR